VPAQNGPIAPEQWKEIQDTYPERRKKNANSIFGIDSMELRPIMTTSETPEEIEGELERRWQKVGFCYIGAYADFIFSVPANTLAAEFVRKKIKQTVKDPDLAQKLTPTGYPVGSKRLCFDTDYYCTYNRPNVHLVDVRANPIERVTPKGIRTKDGIEHEFDAIVFATGFDGMTGALTSIDIKGHAGTTLKQKWCGEGPKTYVGLAVQGFPNMFLVTGPGSPSVLSNMLVAIEQHVDWISDCVKHMRETGKTTIEATEEAQNEWVGHVSVVANATIFPQADSWYVGANVPGKPRVFMPYCGGVVLYTQKLNSIVANGYEGFHFA